MLLFVVAVLLSVFVVFTKLPLVGRTEALKETETMKLNELRCRIGYVNCDNTFCTKLISLLKNDCYYV